MQTLTTLARSVLITAVLCVGCTEPSPPEATYLLVLNPTSAVHQAASRSGFEQLLTSATPGEEIVVLEAPTLRTVCRVVVPDVRPPARMFHHAVGEALAKLQPLLVDERSGANGQLNLPGLSGAIARLKPADGLACRVYLIGTPVFNEARFRGDSWLPGVAPKDGYWFHPDSPLCRGIADFPKDTKIALLLPPEGYGMDAAHRSAIEQSWRKHAKRYGAELVRYSDDPHAVFGDGTQYSDLIELDPNAPCELYVAAAQGSQTLAVQIGSRRTSAQGAAASTRNQVLARISGKTGGLTLLVDNSVSTVGRKTPGGDYVFLPERVAEFNRLREKLGVLLQRAEAGWLNVIGFGVESGEGGIDAVWPAMQPATAENRSHAQQRLLGFTPGSGTPALRALQLALSDTRCTRIVLVTDGLPDSGQTAVLDWLARARDARQFQLYTIGIGDLSIGEAFQGETDWPVREFLTTAAAENAGAYVEWSPGTK